MCRYVMDEFGSRIPHSDAPTHRLVPFLYAGDGLGYSLLFPVRSVEAGGLVTRDKVEQAGSEDAATRAALLCTWPATATDLTTTNCSQGEPGPEFWSSARQAESLPDPTAVIPAVPASRPLLVYSEYPFINQHLTHPRFQLTDTMADADILWLSSHFKEFRELRNLAVIPIRIKDPTDIS